MALNTPRFSIITPSYRAGDWLRLCMASVADQDPPREHIVQDAGSDDGTLDWLPTDPRVKVFVEQDRGMYDAINRGLRRANGEILAYLNADEQYLPGALAGVDRYFREHPEVEVLFADAVVVDGDGRYLWHRKSLVPRLWHTELFPLSILTCATFFRRRVLDRDQLFFDPEWRYCGDSVWVRALLRRGLAMGTLGQFTSAFTHTGENLSLRPGGREEARRFFQQASLGVRCCKPWVLLHHRLRRLLGRVYQQSPFRFAVYTRQSRDRRVEQEVERPTYRWKW